MKEKNSRKKFIIAVSCTLSLILLSCTVLVYAADNNSEVSPDTAFKDTGIAETETVTEESTSKEESTEPADTEAVMWVPLDFTVIVDTHPNERKEIPITEMPDEIGGIPIEELIKLQNLFLDEYEAAKERLGVAHVDETKTVTPEVQALFDEFNAKSEELEEKYNYPTNKKTVELNALSDWLLEELEHTDYWKTTKEERELLSQAYREAMEVYDGARDEILNEITERKISDILCYN